MLVKTLNENGLIKTTYSSSNIVASTYDKVSKELIITFSNGGQYKYYDVSLTDYTRFEMADSQGAVHNTHIKKYKYESLGKIDVSALITEINDLKENQKKQLLEDSAIVMVHKLQTILTHYHMTGVIEPDLFKKGIDAMNDYKTKSEVK